MYREIYLCPSDQIQAHATSMRCRGADVINQLILDEIFALPNRVESLADCQRDCGVLANDMIAVLILCQGCIFNEEQTEWLTVGLFVVECMG